MNKTFGVFDVRDMGAAGNGVQNDTAAFQRAIDEAAKVQGSVFVPPGNYLAGELQMAPYTEIRGCANYGWGIPGGTMLTFDPGADHAKCLLNLTGAFGCRVTGLCLNGPGAEFERVVHGIMVDKPDYGKQEDTPIIDDCRVGNFSGDGMHFERIWCFSVRHSQCFGNGGCGVRMRGWDGYILDCWFSRNHQAGFGAYDENASISMNGNRIEWNWDCGIVIIGGNKCNLTSNYLDRSGKTGIKLVSTIDVTLTGNVIYRSGRPAWTPDPAESLHLALIDCRGVTAVGNTLNYGRDDGGQGDFSPETSMYIRNGEYCVVTGNTQMNASLKALERIEGVQKDCVIRDNPGCLAKV